MAVSRSNPWGLVLIFASVFGQCFSIQSSPRLKSNCWQSLEIRHLVRLPQKPTAHLSYCSHSMETQFARVYLHCCIMAQFNGCEVQNEENVFTVVEQAFIPFTQVNIAGSQLNNATFKVKVFHLKFYFTNASDIEPRR